MSANNRFNPLAREATEPSQDDAAIAGSCSTAPTALAGFNDEAATTTNTSRRRKTHRAGKKRRSRRKSFAALPETNDSGGSRVRGDDTDRDVSIEGRGHAHGAMYRLGT